MIHFNLQRWNSLLCHHYHRRHLPSPSTVSTLSHTILDSCILSILRTSAPGALRDQIPRYYRVLPRRRPVSSARTTSQTFSPTTTSPPQLNHRFSRQSVSSHLSLRPKVNIYLVRSPYSPLRALSSLTYLPPTEISAASANDEELESHRFPLRK